MALTIVQAQIIEFAATEIIEYIALMNKVKTMSDEDCKSQLLAQREIKRFQREKLDSH